MAEIIPMPRRGNGKNSEREFREKCSKKEEYGDSSAKPGEAVYVRDPKTSKGGNKVTFLERISGHGVIKLATFIVSAMLVTGAVAFGGKELGNRIEEEIIAGIPTPTPKPPIDVTEIQMKLRKEFAGLNIQEIKLTREPMKLRASPEKPEDNGNVLMDNVPIGTFVLQLDGRRNIYYGTDGSTDIFIKCIVMTEKGDFMYGYMSRETLEDQSFIPKSDLHLIDAIKWYANRKFSANDVWDYSSIDVQANSTLYTANDEENLKALYIDENGVVRILMVNKEDLTKAHSLDGFIQKLFGTQDTESEISTTSPTSANNYEPTINGTEVIQDVVIFIKDAPIRPTNKHSSGEIGRVGANDIVCIVEYPWFMDEDEHVIYRFGKGYVVGDRNRTGWFELSEQDTDGFWNIGDERKKCLFATKKELIEPVEGYNNYGDVVIIPKGTKVYYFANGQAVILNGEEVIWANVEEKQLKSPGLFGRRIPSVLTSSRQAETFVKGTIAFSSREKSRIPTSSCSFRQQYKVPNSMQQQYNPKKLQYNPKNLQYEKQIYIGKGGRTI